MIKIGDKIPAIQLKRLNGQDMESISAADVLGTGRVVLFAVPGAFTPTCSAKHLPGYIEQAATLKEKGVDKIVCLAVNDPFVMKSWLQQNDPSGTIEALPDGNADFTRTLGLEFDASGHGLGMRAKRFSMLIENGVVQQLNVEEPGDFRVSTAETMLEQLQA